MNKISTFLAFLLMSSMVSAESFSEEEVLENEEQERFLEAYAAELENQDFEIQKEEIQAEVENYNVYYDESYE